MLPGSVTLAITPLLGLSDASECTMNETIAISIACGKAACGIREDAGRWTDSAGRTPYFRSPGHISG